MKRKIVKTVLFTVVLVLLLQIGCFADVVDYPFPNNNSINSLTNERSENIITNEGSGNILSIIAGSVIIIFVIVIAIFILDRMSRKHLDMEVSEESDDGGE